MSEGRKTIESYRDLVDWQKSMDLAVSAYQATHWFPVEERYGLVSQMRRSSSSVPANIAEGYGRESPGAYAHHLKVAQGSLKEFETHAELAHRVGQLEQHVLSGLLEPSDQIGKMLRSLIRAVGR